VKIHPEAKHDDIRHLSSESGAILETSIQLRDEPLYQGATIAVAQEGCLTLTLNFIWISLPLCQVGLPHMFLEVGGIPQDLVE